MTEPTTEAGKRASSRGWLWMPVDEAEAVERTYGSRADARWQRDMDMVNDAVAAERARIAEAVLREVTHDAVAERMQRVGRPWTVGEAIKATVDTVLALLETTDD